MNNTHNIVYKEKDTCYVVDLWNTIRDRNVFDSDILSLEKNTFEYDFVCDYYRYIYYFKQTINHCYHNDLNFSYNPRRPAIENRTEYIEDAMAFFKCIKFMNVQFKIKSDRINQLKKIIEDDLDFYYIDYIIKVDSLDEESFEEIKNLECDR